MDSRLTKLRESSKQGRSCPSYLHHCGFPSAAVWKKTYRFPDPPRAQQQLYDSLATLSRVEVTEVAPGLRGLTTTEPIPQGHIALNIPFQNTLSVPLTQDSVVPWTNNYLYQYEEAHGYLPEPLIDFLQCKFTAISTALVGTVYLCLLLDELL